MAIRDGTFLITGATSGIGLATARHIAASWPEARFLLTGRRQERLDEVIAEIGEARAMGLCFDVRDRDGLKAFAEDHGEELAEVNVLINNAGLAAGLASFQESDLDDWEQMIDTNIKGLLYMTRALLPQMIAKGEGHIVNIGSVAGRVVYPKGHVYNATKFAVHALTEALRIDTLGTGVRVTTIAPGMVETEFSRVRFKGDEEKAKSVYQGLTPLTPDDVAEAVLWSLERPAHVNIQEILIMPTDQAGPQNLVRK